MTDKTMELVEIMFIQFFQFIENWIETKNNRFVKQVILNSFENYNSIRFCKKSNTFQKYVIWKNHIK